MTVPLRYQLKSYLCMLSFKIELATCFFKYIFFIIMLGKEGEVLKSLIAEAHVKILFYQT